MQIKTYIISLISPKSADIWIEAYDRRDVRFELYSFRQTGLIAPFSFERPNIRMPHLGMSGRAYQSGFTVACSFSHRRAWQTILNSNDSNILILEDDAYCKKFNLEAVIKQVNYINMNWHMIQLGRCWDFCKTERIKWKSEQYKLVESDSSCCSHAYILNRKGAEILLQNSLPHITSVDLLFNLLSRKRILNMYSLSPPICTQKRIKQKNKFLHDDTQLVECDPNELNLIKNHSYSKDDFTLSLLQTQWIQYYTHNESHRSQVKKNEYHANESTGNVLPQMCKRGIALTNTSFSKRLDNIQIDTIVIYGTAKRYDMLMFQKSIDRFIPRMLPKHMKLCWVKNTLNDKAYFESNTLFFMFPSEMILKKDKIFQKIEPKLKNKYIFHGTPPHKFRKFDNWFRWENGNKWSVVDSLDYLEQTKYISFGYDSSVMTSPHSSNDSTIYITYDIPAEMFCQLAEKCKHLKIVKYGRKPMCKKSTTFSHIPYENEKEKLNTMLKNRIVPILSYKKYIPPEFYEAAVRNKIIMTNNPYIKSIFKYVAYKENIKELCDISTYKISIEDKIKTYLLKHEMIKYHSYEKRLFSFIEYFFPVSYKK